MHDMTGAIRLSRLIEWAIAAKARYGDIPVAVAEPGDTGTTPVDCVGTEEHARGDVFVLFQQTTRAT